MFRPTIEITHIFSCDSGSTYCGSFVRQRVEQNLFIFISIMLCNDKSSQLHGEKGRIRLTPKKIITHPQAFVLVELLSTDLHVESLCYVFHLRQLKLWL